MRLRDVDVETFQLYIHWVYTRKIELDIVDTEEKCYHSENHGHHHSCERALYSRLLVNLYIAGDLLLDDAVKRVAMDRLIKNIQRCLCNCDEPFSWKLVDRIWNNTLDGCALQRCVLRYFWAHTSKFGFPAKVDHMNAQFLLDLCNLHFRMRGTTRDSFMDFKIPDCNFHDHEDGENCHTVVKREPEE